MSDMRARLVSAATLAIRNAPLPGNTTSDEDDVILANAALDAILTILAEPDEAMVEAGADTPGMKAASDAMVMYQVRGFKFADDAFESGSPLHQAFRAMLATIANP